MIQTKKIIKIKKKNRTSQKKKRRTLKNKQTTLETSIMVRLNSFQTRTLMKTKTREVMEIRSEVMRIEEIIEEKENLTRTIIRTDLLAEMTEVTLKEIMRNFTKTTTYLCSIASLKNQLHLNFALELLMMTSQIASLKKALGKKCSKTNLATARLIGNKMNIRALCI